MLLSNVLITPIASAAASFSSEKYFSYRYLTLFPLPTVTSLDLQSHVSGSSVDDACVWVKMGNLADSPF